MEVTHFTSEKGEYEKNKPFRSYHPNNVNNAKVTTVGTKMLATCKPQKSRVEDKIQHKSKLT